MSAMDDLRNSNFCEAVLRLRSVDECQLFFENILSDNELKQIVRRFNVAELLYEGATYREIIKKTNAANLTISRVKRVLESDESILRKILDRGSF